VEHWYDVIGNPTIADAILDRLVKSAYRMELSGESYAKIERPRPQTKQRRRDRKAASVQKSTRLNGRLPGINWQSRPASPKYEDGRARPF
jgi:hypothetical protein